MRPSNYLPKPALLFPALTALSLFGALVYAQESTTGKQDDKSTDAPAPSSTADDKVKSTDAPKPTETSSASSSSASEKTSEEAKSTEKAKTTEEKPTSKTQAPSSTSTTLQTSIAAVSSIVDSSGPTDLPTLTGNPGIPTYPAPAVPPTQNAPFMRHSSAPEGTVFIAVGAILGAFGLAILLWRGIVGLLLHRSVERAARAQQAESAKGTFPAPPAPFYKYSDQNSTMSLSGAAAGASAGAGAAAGRGVRRTTRGPTPSSNPSQSNLFFSPTAATNNNAAAGNRGSSFLPSGFYAAGNSSPGGHGMENSVSLTNLRPDSHGHWASASRHTLDPSPPESPAFPARRDFSNTSLNLHRPPSQRAPSAFLDDLLADDPNALPPPRMPPAVNRHSSYGHSGSPGPQNRF